MGAHPHFTYNVQVAHVPNQKLQQSLVNVKDKLSKEKFPGVVYVVPCADCDVYIGETGNFEKRLKQHNFAVRKENVKSSALAEHAASGVHAIDWGKPRVLAREKGLSRCLYLESLMIQTTPCTLNRSDGNLPSVYVRCLRHMFKPI